MALAGEESVLARELVERGLASPEAIERCEQALERLRARGQPADLRALLVAWKVVAPGDLAAVRLALEKGEAAPIAVQRIGPYVVLGVIGEGGMGTVYEAKDPALGRAVALKVVPFSAGDARRIERLRREAKALASLRHPHIVSVHATGETRDVLWIALELVQGRTLAERIAAPPPLAAREAAALLAKVARALQVAHDARILHRDVKPTNILIDAAGEPRLADFGLALDLAGDARRITREDAVVGTPNYLSPEQTAGTGATALSDVWALGVTLYETLSGDPPFRAASSMELFGQIAESDPPPLPSVPRALELVCRKALEKEPGHRYRSAAAFAADLEAFLRGDTVTARPPGLLERLGRTARRRRRRVAALVLVATAVAGAAPLVRWLRARSDEVARNAALRPYEEALAKGRAAETKGDLVSALSAYDEAVRGRPDDPVALAGRGRVEEALGDFVSAERTLGRVVASVETAVPAPEAAATLGALARALLDRRTLVAVEGDTLESVEQARRLATRARTLAPDDPLVTATLARQEASLHHDGPARDLLESLRTKDAAALAEAALARGIMARNRDDFDATAFYAREAAHGPPRARIFAAWMLECAGESEEALALVEATARAVPDNASVHRVLARIHAQELRFRDAERETVAAAARGSPDSYMEARLAKALGKDAVLDTVRAILDRAAYLVERGDARDGERALELTRRARDAPKEARADISDLDIYVVAGKAALLAGDPAKAFEIVDATIRNGGTLGGGGLRALKRIEVQALVGLARDDEAIAVADEILAPVPRDAEVTLWRLRALVHLGRLDDAKTCAEAFASGRARDDEKALELLVYVDLEAGRYADALEHVGRTAERPTTLARFAAVARRLSLPPLGEAPRDLPPSFDWGDSPAAWTTDQDQAQAAGATVERDPRRVIYGTSSVRLSIFKGGDASVTLLAPKDAPFDLDGRALSFWIHAEELERSSAFEGRCTLVVALKDAKERELTFAIEKAPIQGPGWHHLRVDLGNGWTTGGDSETDVHHVTQIAFRFTGVEATGGVFWIDGIGPAER